ncbi:MAG: transketolase [Bacteroides sp.]|nr:transketolase [Ruminococcus flavefaciens]MCM1555388.1 transketolase [Bacteroides sp.]
MLQQAELQQMATQVRRDVVRMIHGAKSGHTGGSLGCADFMTVLFFNVLEHDPKGFTKEGRNQDVFFLSNGHIAPVLYSVLARTGYFPVDELGTLRQLGSRLQGHPSIAHNLPGIRMASGSLGQGMSNAIGMALAKKMDGDRHLVYTLHGDGELEEGQIWESAMYAGAKQVDNLISVVDHNGLQIDGATKDVMDLGDLNAKFTAFGWDVLTMNGNDVAEVEKTLKTAKEHTGKGKPVMIVMRTEMGHGVDFMANLAKWHGTAPNDEQAEAALAQLLQTPYGDYKK